MRRHSGIKRARVLRNNRRWIAKKHESHRPYPRVSAIALIAARSGTWPRLEDKSPMAGSWSETREVALFTMRSFVS